MNWTALMRKSLRKWIGIKRSQATRTRVKVRHINVLSRKPPLAITGSTSAVFLNNFSAISVPLCHSLKLKVLGKKHLIVWLRCLACFQPARVGLEKIWTFWFPMWKWNYPYPHPKHGGRYFSQTKLSNYFFLLKCSMA